MQSKTIERQIDLRAFRNGIIAMVLLAGLIVMGSRGLRDFDPPLAGYAFACLFATFGLVYRYSVWLSKPPTRRFWRRGWQMFLSPRLWRRGRAPRLLTSLTISRVLWQGFIMRRGFWRWAAHMLIAWGCMIAAAITFPLVFGWIHFEQAQIYPEQTYSVIFFGIKVQELPLTGLLSWCVFHGLIIASFMVIPGVMIAMYRRMTDTGAIAVQRFGRDMLPLIMLFLISASGLLLWASYEFMEGYFYGALAHFHALTVIGTLIYLPFGKLFHIFQRPAQLGVAFFRAANNSELGKQCPVTGEAYAPQMQIDDLNEVLVEMDFDYGATSSSDRAAESPAASTWQEVSPRGRRMLIGRSHNALRDGKFD